MNTFTDPLLGKVIGGYQLNELIGRGNITAVYRAHAEEAQLKTELLATILLVPEALSHAAKTQFQERFLQEAQHIFSLRHPNILPLHGYGEQEGYCYFLSPEINGETLVTYLKRRKRLRPLETLSILTPIAVALDYLHSQGWAHKFFNPANILLLDEPALSEQTPIRLTGLGMAQVLRMMEIEEQPVQTSSYEHLQSITGTYLGTPEYLAPEIVKGAEGDARSDIYALGVLLFTLLSGTPPFEGDEYVEIVRKHTNEPLPSLHERSPDVPIALELVVNHALHRNPDYRFQTVGEMVATYAQALDARVNASSYHSVLQTVEQVKALAGPLSLKRLQAPSQIDEQRGALSILQQSSLASRSHMTADTATETQELTAEVRPRNGTSSGSSPYMRPTQEANKQKEEIFPASADLAYHHLQTEVSGNDVRDQFSRREASSNRVQHTSPSKIIEEEPSTSIYKGKQVRETRPLTVPLEHPDEEVDGDLLSYSSASSGTTPGHVIKQASSNRENVTNAQRRLEMIEMAQHLQLLRERLQLPADSYSGILLGDDDQENDRK